MKNQDRFWVYDWLDTHGVDSVSKAKKVLASRSIVDKIPDFAEGARSRKSSARDDFSIVAGRGLDLSGHLDCNSSACRLRQVDDLFRHAWHYFDHIVVADAMSHEISTHWDAPLAARKTWLLSHIEVLLHLRRIGAEHLVIFREKPPPCELHWEKHATEVGLERILSGRDRLLDKMLRDARVEIKEGVNGSLDFVFVHPKFEHTVWGSIEFVELPDRSETTVRKAVATAVLRRYTAHLSSDVATSKKTDLPLGSTIWLHGNLLRQPTTRVSVDDVAFAINLPVLNGVPLKTLLKIRSDERDAFVRFRHGLRQAITERLKAATKTQADKLASEVRRDVIDPALENIRQRLASAERMLAKKTAVGVTLGGLMTICGLLSGIGAPLATAAGVGTLINIAGAAGVKDIEERRDVSLSDMYFLWKALQHKPHKRDD